MGHIFGFGSEICNFLEIILLYATRNRQTHGGTLANIVCRFTCATVLPSPMDNFHSQAFVNRGPVMWCSPPPPSQRRRARGGLGGGETSPKTIWVIVRGPDAMWHRGLGYGHGVCDSGRSQNGAGLEGHL